MAKMYCSHCHELISDRAPRCLYCKKRNRRKPLNPFAASMTVCVIAGFIFTGIYARLMFLFWPRWEKVFNTKEFETGDSRLIEVSQNAEEAAILIGVLVFFSTALLTAFGLRGQKMK